MTPELSSKQLPTEDLCAPGHVSDSHSSVCYWSLSSSVLSLRQNSNLGLPHPVLSWGGLALLFAAPIWLLTIPFAVLLENAKDGEEWPSSFVGNLLAPIAYIVVGQAKGARLSAQADGSFFIYALIVSLPTTFLYVLLLYVLLLSLLNRFIYKRNVNPSLLQ